MAVGKVVPPPLDAGGGQAEHAAEEMVNGKEDSDQKQKELEQEWLRQQAKDKEEQGMQGHPGGDVSPQAQVDLPHDLPMASVAFTVRFETTVGTIDIVVRPDWAPHGTLRFLELAAAGDFDDHAFYRAVPGCIVQFGLPPKHELSTIPDDPPTGVPFLLGAVAFAAVGENTRRSTIFICTGDMSHCLGRQSWETPIGAVAESSLEVLERIDTTYGDIAEFGGEGPETRRINVEGNAYLRSSFPRLSYILRARPLDWVPVGGSVPRGMTRTEQAVKAAKEAQERASEAAKGAMKAAEAEDPQTAFQAAAMARRAAEAAQAAAAAAEAAGAALGATNPFPDRRSLAAPPAIVRPSSSGAVPTRRSIPVTMSRTTLPGSYVPSRSPPHGGFWIPQAVAGAPAQLELSTVAGGHVAGAPISPKLQQPQLQQTQLQQPQLQQPQLQQPQLQQPQLQQPQLQQPQLQQPQLQQPQLQQPSVPCIRPPQIHPCQVQVTMPGATTAAYPCQSPPFPMQR